MDSQLNELSKGDKASGSPGRYDLRSKKNTKAPDVPEQSTRTEKLANEVADVTEVRGPNPSLPLSRVMLPK
jgi:hypothetical protein